MWPEIKIPFHAMLLKSIDDDLLPESLRQGVISLLEKPGKDQRLIANWRPLTLLNCDYKIFAKALANRLECVIQDLIHSDQAGFLKGRSIADNLMDINSIIKYSEANNIPAVIIAIDFCKAYDCVSWVSYGKYP